MEMKDKGCDIGLIGLGVMGKNFALNMADHGFKVGVYNRTEEKTRQFMEEEADQQPIEAGYSLKDLAGVLKQPRSILIFVPAGGAVDEIIDELTPHLDPGDLIVDCGNSHFEDTNRRNIFLTRKGFLFMGMGVSGGEYGARHGPSLMPGGSEDGYQRIRGILQDSAAQVNGDPCVTYLGPGSAGHYVKMVHNGIEYGIMQLIAESYDLLRRGLKFDPDSLRFIYAEWNERKLNGYLMEITAKVLGHKDETTGKPLVDMILDRARQKGTGKWTSNEALELQTPVPIIDVAVAMRNLSDYKEMRREASRTLNGPLLSFKGDRDSFVRQLESAMFAAVIITYAQGLDLLHRASREYDYRLHLEEVARIWRGGCIIRAALLEEIRQAFSETPGLENLILSPGLGSEVKGSQEDLREVVCAAVRIGLPVPGLMSALAYYDACRSARLPADLIMAQRDYFGAHRYERIDAEGTFHTKWE